MKDLILGTCWIKKNKRPDFFYIPIFIGDKKVVVKSCDATLKPIDEWSEDKSKFVEYFERLDKFALRTEVQ